MTEQDDTPSAGASTPRETIGLAGLVALQGVCALFLLADAAGDLTGLDDFVPLWMHHLFEVLIVLALCLGTIATARRVRALMRRQSALENQLRVAGGDFASVVEEEFDRWSLTPSEREVALLSMKGLATAEIAALRGRREGTVKAQLNAVYTKAGVSGRHQLLSLFVEELVGRAGEAPTPPRESDDRPAA